MEWKKVLSPDQHLQAHALYTLAQQQAAELRRVESALADALGLSHAELLASYFGDALRNGEHFREPAKRAGFVVTEVAAHPPAVPISESVTDEYIVCLEDGVKLQMLKRHLAHRYGMTPDDYRRKWRLPPDYPMTAPGYSRQHSEFAKAAGLGTSPIKRREK